jgi:hypothetical protein
MQLEVIIFNQVRSLRCDYARCALLRDNVQHRLEEGLPSGRFVAIHALADSPWDRAPATIDPKVLSSELEVAWPRLRDLPIASLAISLRTRAALTHAPAPPAVRGTVLRRMVQWPVPLDLSACTDLRALLGGLVSDLTRIAQEAPRSGQLVLRSIASTAGVPTADASKFLVRIDQ